MLNFNAKNNMVNGSVGLSIQLLRNYLNAYICAKLSAPVEVFIGRNIDAIIYSTIKLNISRLIEEEIRQL